jgi:hypothetical protein
LILFLITIVITFILDKKSYKKFCFLLTIIQYLKKKNKKGKIVQLVECRSVSSKVAGSSPVFSERLTFGFDKKIVYKVLGKINFIKGQEAIIIQR